MEGNTCNTCEHYRHHYTLDQRKIFRVYCGHCTYGRAKAKKPHTKVCEHYVYADIEETLFVSKEYLSKSLLEYVLKMELLPEICDIVKENTIRNR